MKRLLLILMITASYFGLQAQNDMNITQWMFNRSVFNPAAAGAEKAFEISIWDREQWMGVNGRPSSQMLNTSYFISKANTAIGLTAAYDRVGFQSNVIARLNIAHHITLSEKMYLSLGVSGGIINTGTQLGKLNYGSPSVDPATQNLAESRIMPDIAAGIELVHKNFLFGISGTHLIGSSTSSYPTFARNLFLYGNYSIKISDNVRIVPGILARSPIYLFQFEGNVTGYFLKDRFWIGAAYRYNDALSGMAGVQIVRGLKLGYAFDFSMGRMQPYNSGTHEMMISYVWKKPRKPMPYFKNVRNF